MKKLALLLIAAVMTSGCIARPEVTQLPMLANAVSPMPGVVAGGRLVAADLDHARSAGIRHVIDLTSDEETPGFDESASVTALGIAYSNLPLSGPADLTLENVRVFDAMLQDAERPVLVHCASGNRVGAMAALRAAWIDGLPESDAIAIGRAWGLKGLEDEVRRRIRAAP